MDKSMLVFQTDFTYAEGAVASMYGVVKSVDRSLEIFDATHYIPQYDRWSASYRLYQYMKFWPVGTIFVSVVDPGVGTIRKACVAKCSTGHYIVTPDNGTLTHIKKYVGIEEVREIDESINRRVGSESVAIFHGRDLFGYCAARLASGIISFMEVGRKYSLDEIVTFDIVEPSIINNEIHGIFEIEDPNFGNLWTNIPTSLFFENGFKYGDMLNLQVFKNDELIFDNNIRFDKSFGMVNEKELIIYNNELSKISVAISQGSFKNTYDVTFGKDYRVKFSKVKV